ncbi:MAG: O-antigen ligase family protein [Phycisphaerales bacterium]
MLGFAVIAGLIGLLAARGLYECFVQHPTVVADFQKNKARIFAENGWSPESSMAKSFERRVVQSEATGWFGFANVYASFAAMGVAAFAALLVGAVRARREAVEDGDESAGKWPVLITGGGLVLSGTALVMAGAKGGYAAAILGLAVAGVLLWLRSERGEKFRRVAWMIGPLAIVAPLLAVVARGAVGEKIGELSILFRWFYMQGAWRIFGAHPMHGVGPDGFQAAYSLAKPALSPEDVTSPHSLLWDWMACLGIGAVAWVVWLVCKSTRIGPAAIADASDDPTELGDPIQTRTLMRTACLIAAASAFVSIPMQVALLLPEEALGVRIGGLVVWCVLSCGALAVARLWSGWVVALAAGAVVMLAHTQIELTGAVVQSCGLLLALVGLAASGAERDTGAERAGAVQSARSGAALAPRLLGVIGCLAAVFVLLGTTSAMRRGEVKLKAAYTVLEPVRTTRETLEAAVRDKSPDAPELARKLQQIEPALMRDAAAQLPTTWPSARNASHMTMQVSQAYGSMGAAAQSIAWGVRSVEYGLGVPDEGLDRALAAGEISGQAAAAAFERLKTAQGGGGRSKALSRRAQRGWRRSAWRRRRKGRRRRRGPGRNLHCRRSSRRSCWIRTTPSMCSGAWKCSSRSDEQTTPRRPPSGCSRWMRCSVWIVRSGD